MRIALITRRYPPLVGGAEKVLSYLAPALAAVGDAEVTVLTSQLDVPRGTPAMTEIPVPRGSLRVVRLGTSSLRFVGTMLYMRNLACWLRANPVDVMYVSMLKHDAFVAVGEGLSLDVPVVLRPEGAGATGDIAWQHRGKFGRLIADRCLLADAVVAISRAVEVELRGAGYGDEGPHNGPEIVRLPNGVPVPAEPWCPRAAAARAAAPRVAFVGRLAPEKGLDTLVDAWPAVVAAHPGARLALIGEGPERPALTARIARHGLDASIEMPGSVADATASLREIDLFVLPSREEGMSIALLEAMALGLPLVASSIPGNRRLVADYATGRLAPPDDPAAFARVILEQLADYDRAVHMARAARRHVVRDYSIDAVAREHLSLFRRLVAERRPERTTDREATTC